MSDTLHKLQVIIEGKDDKLRQAASRSTQSVRKMTASINAELQKIKTPMPDLKNEKITRAIGHIREYIKQAQMASGIKVPTDDYENLGRDIARAEKELAKYQTQKAALSSDDLREETEDYRDLQKSIEDTRKRLNQLIERQEKMKAMGVSFGSKSWKSLQYDIEETRNALEAYKQDAANMRADGSAWQMSQKWKEVTDSINQAESQLRNYRAEQQKLEASGGDLQFAGNLKEIAGGVLSKTFGGMKSVLNGVTSAIKRTGGAFASLIQRFVSGIPGINRTRNSMNRMGNTGRGLGGIFRTLGMTARFMFASFLIRGALSGAAEGLKNLAQYSQTTNTNISALQSGLTQLKNSLATAFEPILSVVTPILDTLISYLVTAANAIAQFMAALTGKSTYTVAKRVASDYAGGLAKTANAANDANNAAQDLKKTLMGFDEINKLEDNTSSSGGGAGGGGAAGGGSGDMFTTETVSNEMAAIAEEVKAYFQDIFKPMQDAWDTYGKSVIDAWKAALGDTVLLLKDIALTFRDVWTGGIGEEVCGNILQILALTGETIDGIAVAFKAAWDDENRGYNYIHSILNNFNSILEVIKTIGATLLEVWNSGTGKETIGNILDLFTGINNVLANIKKSFKAAWEDGGSGKNYIQSIFGLFNSTLGVISSIGSSLSNVWESGSGQRVIGNILSTFTNINTAISNIADNFSKAWKNDGGGTRILQGLTDILETALRHVNNITAQFKKWGESVDFSSLVTALEDIVEAAKPLADKMGAGLEWLFKKVLEPLATWAAESLIPAVLDLISAALSALDEVIDAAKPMFGWLWNSFLKPLGEWTGDAIIAVLEGLTEAFKNLGDGISAVLKIFEKFSTMFGKTDESMGLDEANMWNKVLNMEVTFTSDGKFIDNATGKEWKRDSNGFYCLDGSMDIQSATDQIPGADKTISGYDAVVSSIKLGNNVEIGKDFIQNALADGTIIEVDAELGIYKNNITGDFLAKDSSGNLRVATDIKTEVDVTNLKNSANKEVTAAANVTKIKDSIPAAGKILAGIGATIVSIARGKGLGALQGISATVKSLSKSGNPVLSNVKAKVTSMTNGIASKNRVLSGIKAKFTSFTQSYTPTINAKANITGYNPYNSRASRMASGGLFSGGRWRPVTAAASGGAFSTGQMFIAREAGPELVGSIGGNTAVMNNDQIVSSVAAGVYTAVVSALSQTSGNGNKTPVFNIYVGGRQVTDVVIEDVNNRTKSTGKCPILT